MIYDAPALAQLAQACAPGIAAEAMLPLIQVESGGDPLRIDVNHGPRVAARSLPEGAALARRYIAKGYSVDVGLAQINSRNFARLGLTVEAAFNPCVNLQAASRVLQENYAHASLAYEGITAISATYSLYNTGTLGRGFRNGYVGRIWQAANGFSAQAQQVATTTSAPIGLIAAYASLPAQTAIPPVAARQCANWVVGETQSSAVVVFP